jgi:hypothetical protein
MSYEQKYLKYKQKYQELKKMLENTPHKLETDNYTDMPDFTLTDTPTFDFKQTGGAEEQEMEVEKDFQLTDTPTEELKGGSALSMGDFTITPPLASCAGQVNPMPNVAVPLPAPVDVPIFPPIATLNKNSIGGEEEELNTTTDLSEIQNTEDIAKLFSQFGGKHKKDLGSSSSSSTTSGSDSDDLSDSDSF